MFSLSRQTVETLWFDTSGNKDYDQTYVVNDDAFSAGLEPVDDDDLIQEYQDAGWELVVEEEDYKIKDDIYGATYVFALIIGLALLLTLVVDLVLLLIPPRVVESVNFLKALVLPGGLKAEGAQKQASHVKMTKMVHNALAVHTDAERRSKSGELDDKDFHKKELKVMLSYQRGKDAKEQVGGILWTWRKAFDGSLFSEEGVWFHSRLMAIGLSQFLVVSTCLYISYKGRNGYNLPFCCFSLYFAPSCCFQSVLIVFLAASGYANYERFKYSENSSIVEQAHSILSTELFPPLNCTQTWRDIIFGASTGARTGALALAPLDVNTLLDGYLFPPPEEGTLLQNLLIETTGNITHDCVTEVISEVKRRDESTCVPCLEPEHFLKSCLFLRGLIER